MKDSSVWQRFIGQPAALIGAVFLLLLGLLAVAAPWLCQGSPWEMNTTPMLAPFTLAGHWLGSDMLGRDLATGLLYGARVSLSV
ncbi:ABC transporter permease, partial [Pseudomonas sp. FSL R10-2398]|nr:ABC transporter permease [Pseudomonas sp. FSL R10-2398]